METTPTPHTIDSALVYLSNLASCEIEIYLVSGQILKFSRIDGTSLSYKGDHVRITRRHTHMDTIIQAHQIVAINYRY